MKITIYDGEILDFPELTPKQKRFLIRLGLKILASDLRAIARRQAGMTSQGDPPGFDLKQAMLTRINRG